MSFDFSKAAGDFKESAGKFVQDHKDEAVDKAQELLKGDSGRDGAETSPAPGSSSDRAAALSDRESYGGQVSSASDRDHRGSREDDRPAQARAGRQETLPGGRDDRGPVPNTDQPGRRDRAEDRSTPRRDDRNDSR